MINRRYLKLIIFYQKPQSMFSLSFFLLYLFASSSSSEKPISIDFKEKEGGG
jgi:hypothetical protein